METLFLNYMNSVHLSKWHYQLIFYIYLIVYVFFYFLFLIGTDIHIYTGKS